MNQSNSNSILSEYTVNSKNVCLCTTVAIFLIILFIISPLNNFILVSIPGKLLIAGILAYTLYKNYMVTNKLAQNTIMSDNLKTNIICSYILSVFILLLFFSVLQSFF